MHKKSLLGVMGGLVKFRVKLILFFRKVFHAAAGFPLLFVLFSWSSGSLGSFALGVTCLVLPLRSFLLAVLVDAAVLFLVIPAAVVRFTGAL